MSRRERRKAYWKEFEETLDSNKFSILEYLNREGEEFVCYHCLLCFKYLGLDTNIDCKGINL
jgi:hypothetical protein